MTYSKLPAIVILLGTIISSFPAFAENENQIGEVEQIKEKDEQRGRRPGKPVTSINPAALLLVSFDSNHDYRISTEEIDIGLARAFDYADKNKRGHLTMLELQDWHRLALGGSDARPTLFAFDPNLDQRITRTEFTETLLRSVPPTDNGDSQSLLYSDLVRIVEIPERHTDKVECEKDRTLRNSRDNRGYGRRLAPTSKAYLTP